MSEHLRAKELALRLDDPNEETERPHQTKLRGFPVHQNYLSWSTQSDATQHRSSGFHYLNFCLQNVSYYKRAKSNLLKKIILYNFKINQNTFQKQTMCLRHFRKRPFHTKNTAHKSLQRILGKKDKKKWESNAGIYLYRVDREVKNFISYLSWHDCSAERGFDKGLRVD